MGGDANRPAARTAANVSPGFGTPVGRPVVDTPTTSTPPCALASAASVSASLTGLALAGANAIRSPGPAPSSRATFSPATSRRGIVGWLGDHCSVTCAMRQWTSSTTSSRATLMTCQMTRRYTPATGISVSTLAVCRPHCQPDPLLSNSLTHEWPPSGDREAAARCVTDWMRDGGFRPSGNCAAGSM